MPDHFAQYAIDSQDVFAQYDSDTTEPIGDAIIVQNRLREIRKDKGRDWTLERVADEIATAFPKEPRPAESDISRLERGEIPLTPKWMSKFAKILDTTISEIIGEPASVRMVPLVGYVGAGDLYYPDPASGPWVGFDVVDAPPGSGDVVAVRVRGDSMAPVFRNGDLLYFSKSDGEQPGDNVGEDCIVQVRNGPTYVKVLMKGVRTNRYRLHSYGNDTPDIENADVEWAAPIRHITRERKKAKS